MTTGFVYLRIKPLQSSLLAYMEEYVDIVKKTQATSAVEVSASPFVVQQMYKYYLQRYMLQNSLHYV
jgi:hypothetical protein